MPKYRIKGTDTILERGNFAEHFPNTSIPLELSPDDLVFLNLDLLPDPEPTPQELLDKLKTEQALIVLAIKAERDRRKINGVYVQNKWIHSDTYSRTQWMAMVMMGASIPAIEWTTMDGTSITTSQTLAGQVFQGCALLDATLFAYAKGLITQVDASTDPSSIDITTGWPATYEGAV